MVIKYWYVLRSKPNKEDFLATQLESRNIEYYSPQMIIHPVNPRSRKIVPYFPGYLFIKTEADPHQLVLFDRIPGAVGLVSFGGEYAYVPDNMLRAIHSKLDNINAADGKLVELFKRGDQIKIESGPFIGYEAIFDSQIAGKERAKVLLTLLSQQLLVEMPVSFLGQKKAVSFSR